MQREDQSREQRPAHLELPQDEHEEDGRRRMQSHAGEVIADERVAPQPMLEPERGMQQRVVLLRCAHLGPDAPQPWSDRSSGTVM